MDDLIRDFKAVVAAVDKNNVRYVRGRLWDPESGVAGATGIMIANLHAGRPLAQSLET